MGENREDVEEIGPVSIRELDELRENIAKIFGRITSEKSRERMAFEMLEAIKTHNKSKFLWLLLKTLNLNGGDMQVKNLINLIAKMHIQNESDENFEKIAYTIVTGIMSAKNNGGELYGKEE